MKVICISGKAQHGKDTTAQIIKDVLEDEEHVVLIAHYGDLVKYVCKTFFGWNGVKDEYGRTLLQEVGTDIVRTKKPGYWADFIIGILELFPDEWEYVLIPDTRFPDEVEKMKDKFETHCLRIERPNFDNGLTDVQKCHPSETSLDNYHFDSVIINPGTKEGLRKAVINWAKELNL